VNEDLFHRDERQGNATEDQGACATVAASSRSLRRGGEAHFGAPRTVNGIFFTATNAKATPRKIKGHAQPWRPRRVRCVVAVKRILARRGR
jgi:hypothetical protein